MASFGEELAIRIGAVQRTLEAESVEPLAGTAQAIRRKRAVRQGTTAGVAAVAAVALAGSGAVAVRRALDAEPAAYYLPPGGGDVSISVDGPDPTLPDIGIECGDPAPEPLLADDGYRLEVTTTDREDPFYDTYSYLEGRAKVTNENEEQFPAFVLHPDVVVVKDGTVVGIVPSQGLDQRIFFTPGRDTLSELFGVWDWVSCGDEAEGERLEPGDYEVYIVATVANSPEIAGLSRLSVATYGGTPYFNGDRWLEPLDWECTQGVSYGVDAVAESGGFYGNYAAACLPAHEPKAQWEADRRAITVEYNDGVVRRVFETHLISEPISHRVNEPAESVYPEGEPWTEPPSDPLDQCGADLGWFEEPSSVDVFSQEVTIATLRDKDDLDAWVWPDFGPEGVQSRVARVATAPDARAILTIQGDVYNEELDAWLPTSEIVGVANVTLNGGDDVSVSRALGPASTSINLSDVVWCRRAPYDAQLTITVIGKQTVTSDAGSDAAEVWVITPGHIL